jgi:hypothetical protein
MSIIKDPDLRRKEQWEKSAQAHKGLNLANLLGFGDLGSPPLSAAEEYSLHSRYLAKANSMNLSDIAEMKIMYANLSSSCVLLWIPFSLHCFTFVASLSIIVSIIIVASILILSINYSYRGGVDSEGRAVMVVVGAHFLLRCLDLERFVLYVVKVIYSDL